MPSLRGPWRGPIRPRAVCPRAESRSCAASRGKPVLTPHIGQLQTGGCGVNTGYTVLSCWASQSKRSCHIPFAFDPVIAKGWQEQALHRLPRSGRDPSGCQHGRRANRPRSRPIFTACHINLAPTRIPGALKPFVRAGVRHGPIPRKSPPGSDLLCPGPQIRPAKTHRPRLLWHHSSAPHFLPKTSRPGVALLPGDLRARSDRPWPVARNPGLQMQCSPRKAGAGQ